MILKEGSILYHTSDYKFKNMPNKPMLFCTFHPSEYTGDNKYLHFIRIKKDISLLFMINNIGEIKIYSALENLIDHPNKNLAKKHDYILQILVKILKKEKFDGWFSSIENKSTVEVSLTNNENIYEIVNTLDFKKNWNNGHYTGEDNNIIITKNWGKYKISTIERPIILNINIKYEKMLEKYKKYEINSKFPSEYIFQIILDNSIITYFT